MLRRHCEHAASRCECSDARGKVAGQQGRSGEPGSPDELLVLARGEYDTCTAQCVLFCCRAEHCTPARGALEQERRTHCAPGGLRKGRAGGYA